MKYSSEIPGPKGHWLWGSLFEFAKDPTAFLLRTAREYPGLSFFREAGYRVYLVSDPKLIEELLIGQHKKLHKDVVTRGIKRITGMGLLVSEGDFWKKQRKLQAPLLQKKQIAAYGDIMVSHAQTLVNRLEHGQQLDLHSELMDVTLRIVLETLFDAELTESQSIQEAIEGVMSDFFIELNSVSRFLPEWLPTPLRSRMKKNVRTLDALVMSLIEQCRERGAQGNDLVSRLLAARYEDGAQISTQQLRNEVVTMVLAGHETTSLALTFALYLLSHNPYAAGKMRAEVDRLLAGRAPTYEDFSELRYTHAVILESMRIYPPAWTIGREAIEAFELGGHIIPKGGQILMSQWVNHRDPNWFEDPESFLPERWLNGLSGRLPRFAYFPFGGGPRVCIGNHFAVMEAVLFLSVIAQSLNVTVDSSYKMEVMPSITLRPINGLPVTIQHRNRA